jgi:hypothetical protein
MSSSTSVAVSGSIVQEDGTIDREAVDRLLERLADIAWKSEGSVALLVETPEPHLHVERNSVDCIAGKGFAGDHSRKSFYRGEYISGREVTAITSEILEILGVDPVVVGDNLITAGIDLGRLEAGDIIRAGEVELQRSAKTHRPCHTFRSRTSPEAFAAVSRERYRGALFTVISGGTIRKGDRISIAT